MHEFESLLLLEISSGSVGGENASRPKPNLKSPITKVNDTLAHSKPPGELSRFRGMKDTNQALQGKDISFL